MKSILLASFFLGIILLSKLSIATSSFVAVSSSSCSLGHSTCHIRPVVVCRKCGSSFGSCTRLLAAKKKSSNTKKASSGTSGGGAGFGGAAMEPCPCGSGQSYARCCGRLHKDINAYKLATASQVVRARYSAYAKKQAEFLMASTHPLHKDFDTDLKRWKDNIKYVEQLCGLLV